MESNLAANFKIEKEIKCLQEAYKHEQSKHQCEISDQANVTTSVVKFLSVVALLCLNYYYGFVYCTNKVGLIEQLLQSLEIKLKHAANLQAGKEQVKNILEALEWENSEHQPEIVGQTNVTILLLFAIALLCVYYYSDFVYVTKEVELKEQLESLPKMKQESERKLGNFELELNLLKDELAEKKKQLLLVGEMEVKLSVKLQAEKEKIKRLQEVLECAQSKHRSDIRRLKMREERTSENLSPDLNLAKKVFEKKQKLMLAGAKEYKLLPYLRELQKICYIAKQARKCWRHLLWKRSAVIQNGENMSYNHTSSNGADESPNDDDKKKF